MRAVVQRVTKAKVNVNDSSVGECGKGLLVYLGIGQDDTNKDLEYLVEKIVKLRIFPDDSGKMNRSVYDIQGEILVVSQFTLYADARKGRRPSYNHAAEPEKAKAMYNEFLARLTKYGLLVASGVFQAHMDVLSQNDGPVTILLDSSKAF